MSDTGQTNFDPSAEAAVYGARLEALRATRLKALRYQGYVHQLLDVPMVAGTPSPCNETEMEAYRQGRYGEIPDADALAQAREEGRNDVLQLILAMQREQRQYAGDCELCPDDPQKPHEYVAVILERLQHQFAELDPPSRACNATP